MAIYLVYIADRPPLRLEADTWSTSGDQVMFTRKVPDPPGDHTVATEPVAVVERKSLLAIVDESAKPPTRGTTAVGPG